MTLAAPRATLLVAVLAIASGPGLAQGLIQNALARESQDLAGEWRVVVDPLRTGDRIVTRMNVATRSSLGDERSVEDGRLVEFRFDPSQTLAVPGSWNVQRPELFFYDGLVWFQRALQVRTEPGRRHYLYFAAANRHARIWVNGEPVGEHRGGDLPFSFDVTGQLHDGENSLLVAVDSTPGAETVPPANIDWWNYGGLVREVRLLSVPESHIREFQLWLADLASRTVRGWVQVSPAVAGQTVNVVLGGLEHEAQTDVRGIAELTFVADLPLWSPEHPTLHSLRVSTDGDTVTDEIGLRTIAVDGGSLVLNGEKLFLRGINLHDERPGGGGRTSGAADSRTLLTWAKELNANFVRLAHYPHSEYTLREADRLGLLVWSEIPVYWDVSWNSVAAQEDARSQLEAMIRRDRNRASIVIWSVANETPAVPERDAFLEKLIAAGRAMDTSRLLSAALLVGTEAGVMPAALRIVQRLSHRTDLSATERAAVEKAAGAVAQRAGLKLPELLDARSAEGPVRIEIRDALIANLDVVGINEYFGWYYADAIADALGLPEVLVRRTVLEILPDLRFSNALGKPMIVTEFGADAVSGRHGKSDQIWSEEMQADIYRRQLAMLGKSPSVVGYAPWILVDYRSRRRTQPGIQDFWNRKGVLSPEGKRKASFFALQEHYRRISVGRAGGNE